MKSASTTFVPEVVKRIETGTVQWRADLIQQYQAQEAFLERVYSAFLDALRQRRNAQIPERKPVISLWKNPTEQSWSPVESCIYFSWEGTPLPEWPSQDFRVAMLFKEQPPGTYCLNLRTGISLKGRPLYSRWFGTVQESAKREFKKRYEPWEHGASHGEVWANIVPFDVSRQDKMLEQAVQDILCWVTVVLPGLAPKRSRF